MGNSWSKPMSDEEIPILLSDDSDYEEEDHGFTFDPDPDQLITYYLIPKLRGEPCGDFIVDKNVYVKEPWLLDHTQGRFFNKDEWYYFSRRTQVSTKNIGLGTNSKRKITGDNDGIDRGNWHLNGSKPIKEKETGIIIGTMQNLTFKTSNHKMQKTGDGGGVIVPGSDSSWIMTEYTLPKTGTFQELVLCKIHKTKKIMKIRKKKDDQEASTTCKIHKTKKKKKKNKKKDQEASTCTFEHGESSSSVQQQINEAHQHECVQDSSLEHEASTCKIHKTKKKKKNKKKDQEASTCTFELGASSSSAQQPEASIGHPHEFVPAPSLEHQINESHPHEVIKTFCHSSEESAVADERNKEETGLERCENLGSEKDDQLDSIAHVACLGADQEEEATRKWAEELEDLLEVNETDLPEEDLIYNTAGIDPDLLDQYDAIRPTESSQPA